MASQEMSGDPTGNGQHQQPQQQQNWPAQSSFPWPQTGTSDANPEAESSERKRVESVFAKNPWQPLPLISGKEHDPSASHLPPAYHSLPSEASAQSTWPSAQNYFAAHQLGGSPLQSHYPSIDHSSAQAIDTFRNLHNISQPPDTSIVNPSASQSFKVPQMSGQGFTIQCGRLSAPTQREAQQMPGGPGRMTQAGKWGRMPSLPDANQLQEYYAQQSETLEGMIRHSKAMQDRLQHTAQHLASQGGDLDPAYNELAQYGAGSFNMQRANSAMEPLNMPQHNMNTMMEPYMPTWQSESVPAELPMHTVNRLQMQQNFTPDSRLQIMGPVVSQHRPGMKGMLQNHQSLGLADKETSSAPQSPKAEDLEELARTGDAEVAHKAFLVPAHKKRGKGGRQPASDPRLDPSIDERKAKRILANRLSAARSKMKQKSQMDGFTKMVDQLKTYKQGIQNDANELMEVCEKMERQNKKLLGEIKLLEEFHSRSNNLGMANRMRNAMPPNMQQGIPTMGLNLDMF